MDTPDINTSNDELAAMIAKGFAEQGERLAEVSTEIKDVKTELRNVKKTQQTVYEIVREFSPKRQQKLEATVQGHEKRIQKLETRPA